MLPFFYFQHGFRSSRSTADHLKIVSDRIARAFNRSRATRAVAYDISKAFRSDLLISILRKLSWFGMAGLITMVLLIRKWMGLFLRKNHLLRC